ncbi:MAG: hypothetical protein WED82_03335, partial [Balneolales bacterium]
RLNVDPARLSSTVTDRNGSFESFLPQELPLDMDAQEFAIINQVELNDQISSGTWLKLPQNRSEGIITP